MRQTRRGLGVTILMIVIALSGCDDGPPAEVDRGAFADGFTDVTDDYRSEVDRIQEQGRNAAQNDPKQVAEVFDALREITERTHGRYQALTPPQDLEQPHAALVKNLKQQGDALRRIASGTRAQAPEPDALKDLAGLLSEFAATQQLLAQRLAEDG